MSVLMVAPLEFCFQHWWKSKSCNCKSGQSQSSDLPGWSCSPPSLALFLRPQDWIALSSRVFWLWQRRSTKATLTIGTGETLFPSLACKCCSVSVKSPDISSWKNPNTVLEEGRALAWAVTDGCAAALTSRFLAVVLHLKKISLFKKS